MSALVYGQDEFIGRWIAQKLEANTVPALRAIGVVTDAGRLIAGVGYCNWRVVDIEMWVAAEPGTRWLTRSHLRAFFGYPFLELGCARVTAICEKRNRGARKFVESLGWTLEGTHPKASPAGGATCSYGMLREHCRWIHVEQPTEAQNYG